MQSIVKMFHQWAKLYAKSAPYINMIVGVGIDLAEGNTIGVSIAHTGAGLLVGSLATAAVAFALGGFALPAVAMGVFVAGGGLLAGFAFEAAYKNNFLGTKTGIDWVGGKFDYYNNLPRDYKNKCYQWQKGSYKMSYGC